MMIEKMPQGAPNQNGLGDLIIRTEGGYDVYSKQPFFAKTLKGAKVIVIAYKVMGEFMVYAQYDKVRKTKLINFCRAIDTGELEPVSYQNIDLERVHLSQLGLMSIMNKKPLGEFLDTTEEELVQDAMEGNILH